MSHNKYDGQKSDHRSTKDLIVSAVVKINGDNPIVINDVEDTLYGYLQRMPFKSDVYERLTGDGLLSFNFRKNSSLYWEWENTEGKGQQGRDSAQIIERIEDGARVRRKNGKIVIYEDLSESSSHAELSKAKKELKKEGIAVDTEAGVAHYDYSTKLSQIRWSKK